MVMELCLRCQSKVLLHLLVLVVLLIEAAECEGIYIDIYLVQVNNESSYNFSVPTI